MGSRNTLNESSCNEAQYAMLVDKFIGSAYAVVKNVSDNLKYVLQVSTYMDQIVDLVDYKQRLLTDDDLGALGSVTLVPLPADVPLDKVVNISVNTQKTTGEFYDEKGSPVTTVISGTNISLTLDAGAHASFANCKAFIRISYTS